MIMNEPVFCQDATNVYRTEKYIVKQEISIEFNEKDEPITFSSDVFYERTTVRDKLYELHFAQRRFIDGKRLPSMSYTRRYVK